MSSNLEVIAMSKVIRISDNLYKRLEAHASGFDTPSNVIEIILNAYESNYSDSDASHNTGSQASSEPENNHSSYSEENVINIHDEIKKLAPNLNENFKDGDLYYAGNVYPTKERVRINDSGSIVLVMGSDIENHFSKLLKEKGVPFKIDQGRYKCYNATNLRKAGLIR
jgi:predicted CopG family antitoxin